MQRSLLAIPVLLVALVAGGCGGTDEGAENPLAVLDLAAKRTADVKTMRMQFTMDADLDGEKMTMEGEGSSTADSQDGVMEATMVTGGEQMTFRMLSVDGTMYLKSDDLPLPAGKEWFKTPDPPTTSMEPGEFVEFLRGSDGVENVGTEEIRGEQTTHFRGPLDLEKLVEDAGGSNEMLEQVKKMPEAKALDIVIDAWVLEDGLPARIAMDISGPDDAGKVMSMTADYLEYDVPVDVEAPPAAKVAEASELGQSS